jgi:hypothetical protein
MIRLLLPLVAFFGIFMATPAEAEACSCAQQSPREYVAGADQVLVARAGATVETKDGFELSFEVLEAIKGKKMATFVWRRTEVNPLCGPEFEPGELSVLFVTKGSLGLCSGNFGISAQSRDLAEYIRAAGTKTTAASTRALRLALAEGLKGYLHGRPKILAKHAPLKGKTLQVGKSKILLRASLPKSKRGKAIVVREALTFGSLTYVSGHYAHEGVTFHMLLEAGTKSPSVLHKEAYEQ